MIHALITEVSICAMPPGSVNYDVYRVTVAWRGDDRYAVCHRGMCASKTGRWAIEPIPSSRTDAWKRSHRFDYDTAYQLAIKLAPKIVINGMSPEQCIEFEKRRRAEYEAQSGGAS